MGPIINPFWRPALDAKLRDMEREADRNAELGRLAGLPKAGDDCPSDCPGDLVEEPPRCWWCGWRMKK